MRAITIIETGTVGVSEVPAPECGPTDILIRVAASGLNRADLLVTNGAAAGGRGAAGKVLGMECAGLVEAVGREVTTWRTGDRVMGLAGGTFAEIARTDHRWVVPVPDGLDLVGAAVLPLALLTMHDAIVTKGGLRPGGSVLILGATSGVGLMGLAIARRLGAGRVIGTSTRAGRLEALRGFGATHVVDTSQEAWETAVLDATNGAGVDIVVDMLSGPNVPRAYRATAIGGRLVNVGRLAGSMVEIDLGLHAVRRLTHIGVTFSTRSADEVADIVARMSADLGDALAEGELRLPVVDVLPLEDGAVALERMAANDVFGKLAMRP